MVFYSDTSVLVAYYCPERLSHSVGKLLAQAEVVISTLTEVEFFSALAKKVRMRELDAGDAHRVLAKFDSHLEARIFRKILPQSHHYHLARDWIGRMATPIRTLDALHLALAEGENLTLLTSDKVLAKAAKHFGVKSRLLVITAS